MLLFRDPTKHVHEVFLLFFVSRLLLVGASSFWGQLTTYCCCGVSILLSKIERFNSAVGAHVTFSLRWKGGKTTGGLLPHCEITG